MTRRTLSHVDEAGRARMVDVSPKRATARRAVAEGAIAMSREAYALVQANRAEKGDVLRFATHLCSLRLLRCAPDAP